MLWNSISKDVVQRMYIESQERASVDRKNDVIKRLEYYHDEMDSYILEALNESNMNSDAYEPTYFNIVKKIINNLARCYLVNPVRTVTSGTEADQEIYDAFIESSKLNPKLKIASRYVQLLKTILLRVVWRNNSADVDVITGDIVDIVCGDVPEIIKQIMITHYPENGEYRDVEYSVWSPELFQRLDFAGNVIREEVNPYLVVPFLPLWDAWPTDRFWLPGGSDLISTQSAINLRVTELQQVLQMQGFGVPTFRGIPDSYGTLEIGPGTAIELEDPNSNFSFEKTNAPIDQLLSAIDFLAKNAALTNGLSAMAMSVKPSQNSGISRLAEQTELQELRKDQISLFTIYEKQLYDLFKVVHNFHSNKKISKDSELSVLFTDQRAQMSPDKQAELWRAQLDMNTLSRVDIIMQQNPALSKVEAENKLEEIILENKQFNTSPTEARNQTKDQEDK